MSSTRITIVGQSGFMAQSLQSHGFGKNWTWLPHDEALKNTAWRDNTDTLINFAYAPALRTGSYDPALDVDSKLAQLCADRNVHYIMLSSRMAYGHPGGALELFEDMPPAPINIYGQNKLRIEQALGDILPPEKLTILRLSNIFGFEPGRRSFFGMALTRLAEEERILYDMSPFTIRDFLSCRRFGAALEVIAARPAAGLYNMGAGFGIETGLIAEWLIAGYGGTGELLVTAMQRHDEFRLNMDRARETFPNLPVPTEDDLKADCVACGTLLKNREETA